MICPNCGANIEADLVHILITRGNSQVGMDEIRRRTVKALQGDIAVIGLVPDPDAPPVPATPAPLYHAELNGVATLRAADNSAIVDLRPDGTRHTVYREHVDMGGGYDDRAVITPPGMPVQHVWQRRLKRV